MDRTQDTGQHVMSKLKPNKYAEKKISLCTGDVRTHLAWEMIKKIICPRHGTKTLRLFWSNWDLGWISVNTLELITGQARIHLTQWRQELSLIPRAHYLSWSSLWLGVGEPPGLPWVLPCTAASLWPPPMVLHLVHRPHGALHILHPHEALVEREIVTNCVLT